MKIRSLLLLTLLAFTFSILTAGTVTRQQAERVAKNFMSEKYNVFGSGISADEIDITGHHTQMVNGEVVFYAFELNEGWIIVSAEDSFEPVLGYSYNGNLRIDDAPAHYKSFLKNYTDQIVYIREENIAAEAEVSSEWERLSSENFNILSSNRDTRDVEPLLVNMWNQDDPYNVMCPEDPNGPGGHAYVGCVATAMAMIMYYWRYPETGTGQHCYTPGIISYGQQCADFGNTEYQWEGMNNSIDAKNPFPNAELQYHAAVSVNMNFSPNGSGSQSWLVPGALSNYFRYNSAQYLEKNNYPTTTWYNILKDELDMERPLYYSGFNSTDGGHAFVCDGYQGNDFHFNFGWSGYNNGYYSLYNVGGFNLGQGCVRYFYPTETDYPYHATGDITLTQKSGSFTDGSGPLDNYINNNVATFVIDPQTPEDSITSIELEFQQFNVHSSDNVKVYDGEDASAPLLGEFTGDELPDAIVSSGNKLCIVFTTDGSSNDEGWYAEYTTSSPIWCSGMTLFTEPSGTFDDGSGSFNYQNGATCLFRIAPEYASTTTLYFNSFETEEGIDRVMVFNETTNELLGEFSGSDIPGPIEVEGDPIFMTFTTNQYENMAGWEAYYEVDNVGLEENEAVSTLSVYPVPAGNTLNISFTAEKEDDYSLRVVSMQGKVVYSEEGSNFRGSYTNSLDVSALAPGIYYLKITNSKGLSGKKMIIQ